MSRGPLFNDHGRLDSPNIDQFCLPWKMSSVHKLTETTVLAMSHRYQDYVFSDRHCRAKQDNKHTMTYVTLEYNSGTKQCLIIVVTVMHRFADCGRCVCATAQTHHTRRSSRLPALCDEVGSFYRRCYRVC